ncbi:MAG: NADAR family protein [Pyrinomonadaceae bacterium]
MSKINEAKDARSRDELAEIVRNGGRPKYLFFWGHAPKVPGRVDQSCLSNWFPAPFETGGVSYATTEHFMMAEKARLFGDDERRADILAAKSPGEAKKLGRLVKNFEEGKWIAHRFEIVTSGNLEKFGQNAEMKEFLLRTGSKVLVEASPRDRIWGIGLGRNNPQAEDPGRWNGLNLLGFSLMEVRQRLSDLPPEA